MAEPDDKCELPAWAAGEAPPPSLQVAYDELRGRAAVQDVQVAALDGKANFGLGSATILAALVALVQGMAAENVDSGSNLGRAAGVVTILALLAYVFTVGASFMAYKLRPFDVVPNARKMVTEAIVLEPDVAKGTIVWYRACNIEKNEKELKCKARWTKAALAGVFVQSVALFLIAVLQVWQAWN